MRQLTEETFAELYPRVAAWSKTGVLPTADPARFEPFAVALAKTLDGLAMDEPRAREQRRRWDGLTGHLRGSSVESLRMDPSNPSVPRSLDSPWRGRTSICACICRT